MGFWPLDFPELPRGDELTAITAQNVFAHVPKPVDFLKACASVMGPKTKLKPGLDSKVHFERLQLMMCMQVFKPLFVYVQDRLCEVSSV